MKKKKRIFAAVLAGVLALGLTACGSSTGSTGSASGNTASSSESTSQDTSLADIQKAGKIRIGLEGDWQPFSYHDADDNLVGYDVEVAQNIAKELGVEAEITEAPWDGLLTGLSTGVYDMVVNGVDVTPDREETFDFSDPYAYDHIDLVVKAENTDITSFDDLKGRTSANSTGSTYAELGEQYGAADTSVQDYLNTTGETDLKVVARLDDVTSYAIPLKKGSDSLREAVNSAIQKMRDDGTLSELSKKYFGADLTNK